MRSDGTSVTIHAARLARHGGRIRRMKGAPAVLDVVAMLPAVRRSFGVGLVVLGLVAGRVAARQQAPTPAAPATGAISGVR
jgi:hypothetical protein